MDVSGDVADLMVKESIQLTEASIKLLAAGSKNLAAFLWALSKDNKKLVGKTHMARLLREGKELKVFRIKESDLAEFRAFAKKNVLFAAVKDSRAEDGMVDLVTNVDFVSQVNLFMERRGYGAPARGQEAEPPKKAAPRARMGAHKTVILKITIMASVRQGWERNNGYLVKAGYPLFFCRHEKQ